MYVIPMHYVAKLRHGRLGQLMRLRQGQAAAAGYVGIRQVSMIPQMEKLPFFLSQVSQTLANLFLQFRYNGSALRVLLVAARDSQHLDNLVDMKHMLYYLGIRPNPSAIPFKYSVYSPAKGLVNFLAAGHVKSVNTFERS